MRIVSHHIRTGTLAFGLFLLAACNGGSSSGGSDTPAGQVPGGPPAQTRGYDPVVLVTGGDTAAADNISGGDSGTARVDSNLSKPWDLTVADGPIRVANAHTNVMTTYDASGAIQGEALRIPGSRGGSHVTGVAYNSAGAAFLVSANGVTAPATYIFSTSSGTLAAWSASSGSGTAPVTVYADPAGTAEYTGLALLAGAGGPYLYAADFQNGRIDTFDSGFNKVTTSGDFRDPDLPAGYLPYNIRALGNRLAVAYVKPHTVNGESTLGGAGEGIVDLFDASGRLDRRLITGGPLNAPRGIALAPDNFGELGGKLLVANAGDGRINAFDRRSGAFAGTLNDAGGAPVVIPGVSGLAFRNGDRIGGDHALDGAGSGGVGSSGDNTLFFTAGTENSLQSAFGRIQPAPAAGSGSGTGGGNGGWEPPGQ